MIDLNQIRLCDGVAEPVYFERLVCFGGIVVEWFLG